MDGRPAAVEGARHLRAAQASATARPATSTTCRACGAICDAPSARYRELDPLSALLDALDDAHAGVAGSGLTRDDGRRGALRDDPGGRPRRADAPAVRRDAEAAARSRRQAADRLADRGARARRASPTSSSTPRIAPTQLIDALGDGARWRVRIRWSREPEPLETGGRHRHRIAAVAAGSGADRLGRHLDALRLPVARNAHRHDGPCTGVAAARPSRHGAEPALSSRRRFRARRPIDVELDGGPRLTFGNIGVYDTALFRELPRGEKLKMLPLYRDVDRARARLRRALRRPLGERRHAGRTGRARRRPDGQSHPLKPRARAPTRRRTPMVIENPLLDFSGLPRFGRIRAEHIVPAIDVLLDDARACGRRRGARHRAGDVGDGRRSDRSGVRPPGPRVGRGAAPERSRQHTGDPRRLQRRAAHGHGVPCRHRAGPPRRLRAFARWPMGRRSARSMPRGARSSRTRCAISAWAAPSCPTRTRRDSRRSRKSLRRCRRPFDDNVLDSENAWAHYVDDEHALAGVPADVIAAARAAAEADGRAGYKLTLRYPCYMPVMQYADDRSLRALMHRAAATLASDLGASPAWDNTAVIARILELRREEARLLGYANFAELSLVPKMAQTPAERARVPARSRARATPVRRARLRRARRVRATQRSAFDDLAAWDLAYVAEKLKAERFAFSEQEVRQYFPEDRVLAGLFRVVETIYGVTVKRGNGGDLASERALLRDPRRVRCAGRPVLPRSLRARRQAERRLDGRCDQPPARARPDCSIRSRT